MSDEEREAVEYWKTYMKILHWNTQLASEHYIKVLLDLVEKQSKEIEELKETLKCTQNSWFEDTQKIEEMKKQLDLDNECEIALNNRIMDLENADKKWEDKIKAKIEEVEQWELYNMKIPRLSTLDERLGAKIGIKYVLQSLLEKE